MEHFKHLADMHRHLGFSLPEDPLFSLLHCNTVCTIFAKEFTTDFYMIGLKDLKAGEILYGRTKYDHDTGSMMFLKPRQIIQFNEVEHEKDAFLLFIHEDYFLGHHLHKEIKKYSYFDYETSEALFLSPKEESVIWDIFHKMEMEYRDNVDDYSKDIILTYIESMLKFAQRFYKRQFINRKEISGKTVSKFNEILSSYKNNNLNSKGLPTVSAISAALNLSPRYMSDLLKQETGKTAIELIHIYLINEAKNQLKANEELTVSEIAYDLGFESLPSFSRLFKKETGLSPNEFKKSFLN